MSLRPLAPDRPAVVDRPPVPALISLEELILDQFRTTPLYAGVIEAMMAAPTSVAAMPSMAAAFPDALRPPVPGRPGVVDRPPVVARPSVGAGHMRELWRQATGTGTSDQALTGGGEWFAPPGYRTISRNANGSQTIADPQGIEYTFDTRSGDIINVGGLGAASPDALGGAPPPSAMGASPMLPLSVAQTTNRGPMPTTPMAPTLGALTDPNILAAWETRERMLQAFGPERIQQDPMLRAQFDAAERVFMEGLAGARPALPMGWTSLMEPAASPHRVIESPTGDRLLWDLTTGATARSTEAVPSSVVAGAGAPQAATGSIVPDPAALEALRSAITQRLQAESAPRTPTASPAAAPAVDSGGGPSDLNQTLSSISQAANFASLASPVLSQASPEAGAGLQTIAGLAQLGAALTDDEMSGLKQGLKIAQGGLNTAAGISTMAGAPIPYAGVAGAALGAGANISDILKMDSDQLEGWEKAVLAADELAKAAVQVITPYGLGFVAAPLLGIGQAGMHDLVGIGELGDYGRHRQQAAWGMQQYLPTLFEDVAMAKTPQEIQDAITFYNQYAPRTGITIPGADLRGATFGGGYEIGEQAAPKINESLKHLIGGQLSIFDAIGQGNAEAQRALQERQQQATGARLDRAYRNLYSQLTPDVRTPDPWEPASPTFAGISALTPGVDNYRLTPEQSAGLVDRRNRELYAGLQAQHPELGPVRYEDVNQQMRVNPQYAAAVAEQRSGVPRYVSLDEYDRLTQQAANASASD